MAEHLSPEGYAAAGGACCPACGGTDLASRAFASEWFDTVTRAVACPSCGATWTAVYELISYEGLRQPQEDTP